MRILIVSYLAPPHNAIGAVRVGKTAKYLTRFGHDVRLLTARDLPLPRTLDVEVPADRLIATPWTDVHAPFQFAIRCVQSVTQTLSGMRRRMSHAREEAPPLAGSSPPPRKVRDYQRRSGLRWFAYAQYSALVHVPDAAAGWYPYAMRAGEGIVREWRPDVILASGGPWTSLLVAARLATRHHIPWVAELRDLWSENPMWITASWRRTVDRLIERRVLRTAQALVTVSEPLAESLRRSYRAPVTVVLNGYDAAQTSALATREPSDGPLRVVYTGNLFTDRTDLEPLLRALVLLGSEASDVRVEIVGNTNADLEAYYEGLAAELDVAKYIAWMPPVSHSESTRIQRAADVLLLLTANNPAERGVYTGKIFEYIGARRPILLIGLQDGVAADLVRTNALGAALLTPEDIARQLRCWLEEKRSGAGIPDRTTAATDRFTREAQTRVVERVLDDVVRTSGAGHPG